LAFLFNFALELVCGAYTRTARLPSGTHGKNQKSWTLLPSASINPVPSPHTSRVKGMGRATGVGCRQVFFCRPEGAWDLKGSFERRCRCFAFLRRARKSLRPVKTCLEHPTEGSIGNSHHSLQPRRSQLHVATTYGEGNLQHRCRQLHIAATSENVSFQLRRRQLPWQQYLKNEPPAPTSPTSHSNSL